MPTSRRDLAESFGVDPARYDRTRAAYPREVIARVVSAAPGPALVDVGCGTGIAARQFLAAGRTVLGVEPDTRMADFARRTGVDVEVATFEAWEPAGRLFDAVVSGTAWHWVDPVAGAAKAARVLRPGGVLAPFGHVYELPAPTAHALADAYRRVAPDSPIGFGDRSILDAYQGLYTRAADGVRAAGGFDEPVVWRHDWERTYSRAELLDLIPTSGGLTGLPPGHLAEVLDAVAATVGESVTLPYATWGLTAIRA
ncbi:class I SAM-dependent methyltransferase [Saccharothrix violaceirubra]|uniref:SAM-dependent methyltransferase n=1 Tax=Saccharothrix violaceirubra TaxID=413306 RepID=A0A7W7T3C6_9PSEU|nr:class I SAM-dependent methyltransferase [Saccharothrix violaceirubra]MBB4965818.1 SAM-dependent methyltransferase [Saccharothrix violaceirubra]